MKLILLFFFLLPPVRASDFSLMLSPVEEAALRRAQTQARQGKGGESPTALRLNGLIYSHQNAWKIWLNGLPIKAGQSVDTFRILKVTADFVEVVWSPSPSQRHHIRLKPNDVFRPPSSP